MVKNHLLKTLIALCCLFGCTACFDFQENLFLKQDGSGNFSFVVDASNIKSMLSMFGGLESKYLDKKSKQDNSPLSAMNNSLEITRRKLLNISGISNVKSIQDTATFNFGLSFNFKNIEALNKAMNKLFEDDSTKSTTKEIVYFTWKNNELTRVESDDLTTIYGKMSSLSKNNSEYKPADDLFNLNSMLATISYTSNYEFENKIMTSNNENAKLSSSLKKLTLKCYPFQSLEDSTQTKCAIANKISFK